jgi:hypothetical protein
MLKRAIEYIRRDLDFTIHENLGVDLKNNLNYYIQMDEAMDIPPFNTLLFDADGIPMYDYSTVPAPNNRLGAQYNYTYASWWAIACLQKFLKGSGDAYRQRFLGIADWLKEKSKDYRGYPSWHVPFDWNLYGRRLESPWVSPMDQGLAMSVLLRAYRLSGEDEYLELARDAAGYFRLKWEEGGSMVDFGGGCIYYEIFPVKPLSMILDGFCFSIAGLYDLYLATGDTKARELFDGCVRTVSERIDLWNYKDRWSRFGIFYLSPPWYHKINLCWLKIFYSITGRQLFDTVARGWDPASHGPVTDIKIKLDFFTKSRWFFLKQRMKG